MIHNLSNTLELTKTFLYIYRIIGLVASLEAEIRKKVLRIFFLVSKWGRSVEEDKVQEIEPIFHPENKANPIWLTGDHGDNLEYCHHFPVIIGYKNLCQHWLTLFIP